MAHIHEKIDFVVEVFIVHKNKVLLRKHDKYKIWLSVGGHIELHEDPVEAAIREVKEEVGLDVELFFGDKNITYLDGFKSIPPPEFLGRHRINEAHEHIVFVYFAKSATDKLILSETEKTEECRWFSIEDLDNPEFGIKNNIKEYAKAALEKIKE